jgi:hypothetical protein
MLSTDYHKAEGGHIRIFKPSRLVTDLQNAGVQQWARHFAHSLHTPYWWLKCLLGPDREDSWPVNLYLRFLTWDIMKQPRPTRILDNLLNPIIGKSIVLYFRKGKNS